MEMDSEIERWMIWTEIWNSNKIDMSYMSFLTHITLNKGGEYNRQYN